MKRIITNLAVLIGVAGIGVAYSQECNTQTEPNYNGKESECRAAVSIYSEFLRQKNLEEVRQSWWEAQKICPQYKPLLYNNGTYVYGELAAEAKKNKDTSLPALLDTLMDIYDFQVDNFRDCYEIQMDRATDLIKYDQKRFEESFNYFKQAFETIPEEKITSANVIYYYTTTYLMVANKKAECDVLLGNYQALDKIVSKKIKEYQAAGNEKQVEYWLSAQATLEKYVAPCASCDKLEEIFKPQTEADPENLDLIKKVEKMLNARGCNSTEYYMSLAIVIDQTNPTGESKLSIGNYYYNKKEYSKSKKYLQEALDYGDSVQADTKEKVYIMLASIALSKGSYKEAFSIAKNISGCDGNKIKAKAIAASANNCGTSSVTRGAVYCLAMDYAEKCSESLAAKYKKYLPTKQQLFVEGKKAGESISAPCWGETTKLRTQD